EVEEGERAAVGHLEEHMRELLHVLAARASVVVLANEMRQRQAGGVLVAGVRPLGVAAAIGPVVQAADRDEFFHLLLLTWCRRAAHDPAGRLRTCARPCPRDRSRYACPRGSRTTGRRCRARPCTPSSAASPDAPSPCRCRRRGGWRRR